MWKDTNPHCLRLTCAMYDLYRSRSLSKAKSGLRPYREEVSGGRGEGRGGRERKSVQVVCSAKHTQLLTAASSKNLCKNCITDLNYRMAGRAGRAGCHRLVTATLVQGLQANGNL